MREIKFRVWDIVWKKMLTHEDLWDAPFNELFISTPDQRPYNIMQYTGLKDRNGREIYEGDIVVDGRENSAEVVFDDGCFCVIGYLGDLRTHPLRDSLFCGERFEVIGNIYENPELLEGAE
ncbi:YopX family protein [Bacillus subtilis]|uniref:YopX family protein n=1 Tax=Bacillus subtilis TaxID=1423 RepID=UPI002452AA40|nr:YopX family protein [Bacillus subtilis]MDH3144560.1 YopX family protein [Bacillus subtilis]MDH3148235.1 YopX family protein [Bacillus subtilis]